MSITGDWVEGEPKWWWKYVFPTREKFWLSTLNEKITVVNVIDRPPPHPWLEAVAAEILESLTMLHTATTLEDEAVSQQLKREAVEKINAAIKAVK
jgi:hypothetical protein